MSRNDIVARIEFLKARFFRAVEREDNGLDPDSTMVQDMIELDSLMTLLDDDDEYLLAQEEIYL